MSHSFHEIADLARKTFIAAMGKKPECLDSLMLVRSHYDFNAFSHAMIHFITNDNLDDAITEIMRERGMKKLQAKTVLTSAIEHGPKSWKDNFDFLYAKGVVMVGGHCVILPPELRTGTPHDTAFQQLSPIARRIAQQSLGYAVKQGSKNLGFTFGSLTQQYLVAQLMSEGQEKDFRISALSMDKDSTPHKAQMTNSAFAVRHFAKETGVNLEGLNIVIREGREAEMKPLEKKTSSQPRVPSVRADAAPRFLAAANDTHEASIKELRQSLSRILGKNGIKPVHAQLYFYLSNMTDGNVPTHEDASQKFGVAQKEIPAIVQNIEHALDAQQAASIPGLAIKR